MERNTKLIDKKFYQYLLPSVMMIFALQFGSLLDGIIIGNLIGPNALTADSLVMPVLYIVQIPGFALGAGGSIVIANLLGKRNLEQANKVFSGCLIFGTAISCVFSIISPFASRPLATLFAESLTEYSYQYIFIYMVTDPVLMLAIMLASFIAVDNNPKLSAAFYIVANAVKVGSEVLFIKVANMGVYGAALSTSFGYAVALVMLVFYVKSKKRMLHFTFNLKGALQEMKNTLKASTPNILTFLLLAAQTFVINIVFSRMITDPVDLVIFGLVSNLIFVFDLFSGGILGLIPTICGVLYGEKDIYSLRSILKKIYIANIIVTAVITAIIMAWPQGYAIVFGYNDAEGMEYASLIIRLYLISAIPLEINKFSTSYYPSIDKSIPSVLAVVLREGVFIIPLTLVLLKTNGMVGYSIARVVTEVAALIVTYAFVFIYETKHKQYKGLFMLEKSDLNTFDISVENKIESAATASKEVADFALEHGVDNRNAQILALATEEMIDNIVYYGYKRQTANYIDVNVKVSEDELLLRIRDDGMPFDPTKYEFEKDDQYLTGGIAIITALADELNYMRVLNLNNTVIKLKLGEQTNGNQN
ncbi:MAG: ATP-binding protein [Clostridia bacterium]|nr:ATP-binding protein [Clostridia bacterium]